MVVGKHDGVIYYTIGQRKGLGIGGIKGVAPGSYFVVSKDVGEKSVPIIAGILVILGMSKVLSYYMIDEMIPQRFSEWITLHIHSRILFLFRFQG